MTTKERTKLEREKNEILRQLRALRHLMEMGDFISEWLPRAERLDGLIVKLGDRG